MKDREQKSAALAYCARKGWFPQLEVDVLTDLNIADRALKITDIDVLASVPTEFVGHEFVLIDCKTLRGESPVNRAIWLRGLADRISARRGFCILKKPSIEADHRYSAGRMGITLMTETEFQSFVEATTGRPDPVTAAIANVDLWDRLYNAASDYPALKGAVDFLKSYYWMMDSESEACRKCITIVRKVGAELDPKKPIHRAMFLDLAALFVHSLSRIVPTLFLLYLQPSNEESLSEAVLMYLYGGRESYEHRNSLNRIIRELRHDPKSNGNRNLSLPSWPQFLQLIRQSLDAPFEINRTPLLLRELAFLSLEDSPKRQYLSRLSQQFPQAAKLAVLAVEYLATATKLPVDFSRSATDDLLKAQIEGPA